MATQEKLKQAVEKLSEQEFERLKHLRKIASIMDDVSIDEINQMPTLYRLELKKALEELGNKQEAEKIRV
ncbi:MAG: hypothetical protein MUP66_02490 [Candidatus Nanohaloarchaeota archaeon QJJ-5]|nr:hypothetical protein [Candidatus Nanohaloarchaeota archaeon QJJ-5]